MVVAEKAISNRRPATGNNARCPALPDLPIDRLSIGFFFKPRARRRRWARRRSGDWGWHGNKRLELLGKPNRRGRESNPILSDQWSRKPRLHHATSPLQSKLTWTIKVSTPARLLSSQLLVLLQPYDPRDIAMSLRRRQKMNGGTVDFNRTTTSEKRRGGSEWDHICACICTVLIVEFL